MIPPDDDPETIPTLPYVTNAHTQQSSEHESGSHNSDDQNHSLPSSIPLPPPVLPHNKARLVEPVTKTLTIGELWKGLGFQSAGRTILHLKTCFLDNFHLSTMDRELVIDIGEIDMIDKHRISLKPFPLPSNFGDVLHVDIGCGCNTGINGVNYGLFVVDRANRYTYIYNIKSLKNDILPAIKKLVNYIGRTPGKVVTDFYHKLMGLKVSSYMDVIGCKLESTPHNYQHQNGLVE